MRVAVTGANSGIGLRAVARFAAAHHEVIAFVRDLTRGDRALEALPPKDRRQVSLVELDLGSTLSIQSAASTVSKRGPLDALINNAAVFDQSVRHARVSADGHELFWATNHLGPTELTARLSAALASAPAPRVVFVASKGIVTMPRVDIRFDALDGDGWFSPVRAYYHSKLAQIMTAMTLAEFAGDVVDVTCVRVPAVRLDPARLAEQPAVLRALYAPKNRVAKPPEAIAEVYERVVTDAPRHARGSDTYIDENLRAVEVPRFARDPENRRRLWDVTHRLIGSPTWAWEAMRTTQERG